MNRSREESCAVKQAALTKLGGKVLEAAQVLAGCLSSGGKVLFFGNGGSAVDAQHLAAELVVKHQVNRGPLAARSGTVAHGRFCDALLAVQTRDTCAT
ncbi:MAG: SIS domain-containing protein [Bacillota bacterium]|nr:SIS domain-containing protein [Bacillota bacterium]